MADLHLYAPEGASDHDDACTAAELLRESVAKLLNGTLDRALDDRVTALTAAAALDRAAAVEGAARELRVVLEQMVRRGDA